MMATYGAKDGTVMRWLSSATHTTPEPTPKRAARIGRVMASSDPKATNRMMTAASSPMPSVEPMGACSARATTGPSSSICSPGPAVALAAAMMGLAVLAGRSPDCLSKVTVAYAMVPSLLTRWRGDW